MVPSQGFPPVAQLWSRFPRTPTSRLPPCTLLFTVALADRVVRGECVGMLRPYCVVSAPLERSAFAAYRFPREVVLLAVRWYLAGCSASRHC